MLNSNDEFSPKYIISSFVKNNLKDIPTMSIDAIALSCHTSKSQISKYVKSLGYETMKDFKDACLDNISSMERTNKTLFSLQNSIEKQFSSFTNHIIDELHYTMNQIDEIQYINTSADKLPSRARRKVKLNSIIYSTVRPNQLHYGIIKKQPENFLVSTGFVVIDVDFEKAVPDYIYYVLTQKEVTEHLQAIAEQSVSAYPSIKPSDIENLELFLPDRITQEKIVAILNSIDKKIKQNNEINNNLVA